MSTTQFNKAREALALTQKSEKQMQEKSHANLRKSANKLSKAEKKESNKKLAAEILELKNKHKNQVAELEEKFGKVQVGVELDVDNLEIKEQEQDSSQNTSGIKK